MPVRRAEARYRRHRRFFGPVTLVWFGTISVLGIAQILRHPEILQALSPHHALLFMLSQPGTTFIILGTVVLCVTGAEALYADLGHFGKTPIRLAWFSVVMPALTLNYFGQGALLLGGGTGFESRSRRSGHPTRRPSGAGLRTTPAATAPTSITRGRPHERQEDGAHPSSGARLLFVQQLGR